MNSDEILSMQMKVIKNEIDQGFYIQHQKTSSNNTGGYSCNVCGIFINGYESAFSHAIGKSHLKKRKLNELEPPTIQEDLVSKTLLDEIVKQDDEDVNKKLKFNQTIDDLKIGPFHLAIQNGILEKISIGGYLCKVCDVNMTDRAPAEQHLNGKSHLKKMAMSTFSNENKAASKIEYSVSPCVTPSTAVVTNSDGLERAIQSGILEQVKSGGYFCKTCKVSINDRIPAEQHINGKLHIKKVKSAELPIKSDDVKNVIEKVNLENVSYTNDTYIIHANEPLRNHEILKF